MLMSSVLKRLRHPRVRILLGTVVGLGLLALVLTKVSLPRVAGALSHVSVPLLLLAAAIAAAYVLTRAWRYHLLLGRGSLAATVGVTAASWGAGQVLPGPGSDAAFVWFARYDLDTSVSRGAGVALVARLLDLASLAIILLVAADMAGVTLARPLRLAAILMAAALVLSLLLFFVKATRVRLLGLAERLPLVGAFATRAELALADISSAGSVVALVTATVLARLLAALEYLCLFSALGAHLNLWQVWLALAVRTLLFALPIQGIGGFGTSQVWWASGLALAGLPLTSALTLGLEVQVLDLVVALPEGLLGWCALRARRLLSGRSRSELTLEPQRLQTALGGTSGALAPDTDRAEPEAASAERRMARSASGRSGR